MDRKKEKIYLVIILLVYMLFSCLLITPDFPLKADNDILYLLGRSIFNEHCYRDIFYPSCPYHTEEPFFYPLILGLGQLFFGENVIFLRLISTLFGGGSLIGIYFFFKKKIPFSHLLFLLFFTATNPWFLIFSTSFATEIIYLFFSFLTLIVFERFENQKKFLPIFVFLLVILFFTRCIGVSLLIAVFFYFIIKKKYKHAFLSIGLWFLFILPWVIRCRLFSTCVINEPYTKQFVSRYLGDTSILVLVEMVMGNIFYYLKQIVVIFIPGYFIAVKEFSANIEYCFPLASSLMNNIGIFLASPPVPFFSFLVTGIVAIMVIIGLFSQIRKKDKKLYHFYIFLYLAILLIFPKGFEETRYLFPLLPFILYYAIKGIPFFGFIFKKNFYFFRHIGIISIILIHFYYNLIPITEIIYNNVSYLANYRNLCQEEKSDYNDHWRGQYFITAPWIKTNTFSNAVVIVEWSPSFYLYSHRQGLFFQNNPCWPDKKTWKEVKSTFKNECADYFITREKKEKKLLQKLDRECENLIFILLVSMAKPEAFFTENVNRVYKIVKVSPEIKFSFKKGIHYYKEKNYTQAISEYKKIVNILPDFFDVYYQMALCYEKKGFLREACKSYEKAIDLQPNYEVAKNRLDFLRQVEKIKNNPNEGKEYLLLGDICLRNYDFTKAINFFKKTLKLNPDLFVCYYNLGISYAYKQKYGLAILYFKKAMRMVPSLKYKARHQIRINQRRRIIWQCLEGS